jgi:hypothetical protein
MISRLRRTLGKKQNGTKFNVATLPLVSKWQDTMDAKSREKAETAFKKYERRQAELNESVRQEQARHDAAIKNMHRLRLLREQRDAKKPVSKVAAA